MPRDTHLLRRGSQYYVNVRVPKELRSVLEKDIIRRSLRSVASAYKCERESLEADIIAARLLARFWD